jgi:hypothetical protein
VKVILDLLHADEKAGGPPPKTNKGKKKFRKPLLRPIICICNDLYFVLFIEVMIDMQLLYDHYDLIVIFCIFDLLLHHL